MSSFCTTGAMIYWALTLTPPGQPTEVVMCSKTEKGCKDMWIGGMNVAQHYTDYTQVDLKCVKEGGRNWRKNQSPPHERSKWTLIFP